MGLDKKNVMLPLQVLLLMYGREKILKIKKGA